MAARTRGLGIGKADIDASRLVFVFVRDSKPRRKVAVPVPDNATFQQFIDQVKAKLKLAGVGDIYLASSGQKVRDLRELQDIDELCVVEAASDHVTANGASGDPRAAAGLAGASEILPQPSDGSSMGPAASMRQQRSLAVDGTSTSYNGGDDEDSRKYMKRSHPLKRSLQMMFPSLFAPPGLPVTARDAMDGPETMGRSASRRRKRRAAGMDVRTALLMLLVMSVMGTMLFMLTRMASRASSGAGGLGGGGGLVTGGGDHAVAGGDSGSAPDIKLPGH